MDDNRLLQREKFIRIGGALLLISPFGNFLMSIAPSPQIPDPWSAHGLWVFTKSVTWGTWALYASSLVVGALMLKGRRSSWVFVLVVLGWYIVMNGLHFRHEVKVSGLLSPLLQLLTNIGLFGLVYVQEFHQRLYPRAERVETATWFKPSIPIRVDFVGIGPWAEVTSFSESEIRMRGLTPLYPMGIESAVVELMLPGGVAVRARLSERKENEYVFKCLKPAPKEIIDRWSRSAA